MWGVKWGYCMNDNVSNENYYDLSFLFIAKNVHNLHLNRLLKGGNKAKINLHTVKAIEFLNKTTCVMRLKFNLRYMKFIYGLYYNFLLLNCKIFLTKTYKVIKKERVYKYSFLLKRQRTMEIFRWSSDLMYLQYDYKLNMRLAWLFFEHYYYYEVSELNSIKLNLLANFNQQKKISLKSRKKHWVLGKVIKFYS